MDLKNSKESLRLRHADLVQLYNKSQQYKDMIEMLDEMYVCAHNGLSIVSSTVAPQLKTLRKSYLLCFSDW